MHQMTCSKWRRRSPWLEINKWRICNHHPPQMLTHKSPLNWNSNIVQSIPKKWRRMLSAIYFLTGSAALNRTILSQSVLNVNCFPFVLRQLNRCWNNSGACMTCQIWYREIICGKHVAHSYRSPCVSHQLVIKVDWYCLYSSNSSFVLRKKIHTESCLVLQNLLNIITLITSTWAMHQRLAIVDSNAGNWEWRICVIVARTAVAEIPVWHPASGDIYNRKGASLPCYLRLYGAINTSCRRD